MPSTGAANCERPIDRPMGLGILVVTSGAPSGYNTRHAAEDFEVKSPVRR